MEAVTRLFLVRPPEARKDGTAREAASAEAQRSATPGTGRPEPECPAAGDAFESLLARLASRPLAAIVCSPAEAAVEWAKALSLRCGKAVHIDEGLEPANGARGARWGSAVRAPGTAEDRARVLAVLDRLAQGHPRAELVVVLHAQDIGIALARALALEAPGALALEPGQAAAVDWAHPEAREFQHAVIALAFDWDVAPSATKVQRFPGGASVLPTRQAGGNGR
jgi:hypothetical protein